MSGNKSCHHVEQCEADEIQAQVQQRAIDVFLECWLAINAIQVYGDSQRHAIQ